MRDVDGNDYIDFICGLGANTLGTTTGVQAPQAVHGNLERGLLHSLPCDVEISVTRERLALIPGAEMARFFKTGADATSAAVRLLGDLTGREKIVTIGYNGWHYHFMFDTPGVPSALKEHTFRMPLMTEPQEADALSLLEKRGSEIALVLCSLPYNRMVSREFLVTLREACKASGVLFVFDEVVTGFRLALGGAQEFYGVQADFVCLSKVSLRVCRFRQRRAPVSPCSAWPSCRFDHLRWRAAFARGLPCGATSSSARRTTFRTWPSWAHACAKGSTPWPSRQARACAWWADHAISVSASHDSAVHTKLAERFVGAMARRSVSCAVT